MGRVVIEPESEWAGNQPQPGFSAFLGNPILSCGSVAPFGPTQILSVARWAVYTNRSAS